ncbi:PREDICTED: amino-terminal enhancer of split [Aptenodytes forsteri]|uniref:amino-terminal enhancer of split n=1 Tax=Aptenodytes forsteri TaxID=9233 RepID=UPI00090491F9|nr:PREDICTED: amino-terminal enhancer of split [Aptenodytes forsteri]
MRDPSSGSSHLPQQLKFTTSDSCDRIKDEFQLLQAQYHSLKLECDKLASEKSEMQRHYVMYYEMSYGLNIEMHKQAEIVKRLNGICAQVLPYLSQEHQQQVLGAIERAKQVTAPELNSIIRQQLQAHQLSQLQALALPLTPLPVGLQPPSLPAVSAGTGLLSLSALGSQAHLSKEDKNGHDGDAHGLMQDAVSLSSCCAEELRGLVFGGSLPGLFPWAAVPGGCPHRHPSRRAAPQQCKRHSSNHVADCALPVPSLASLLHSRAEPEPGLGCSGAACPPAVPAPRCRVAPLCLPLPPWYLKMPLDPNGFCTTPCWDPCPKTISSLPKRS